MRLIKNENGNSLLEFSIYLPLIFIFLFVIADVGNLLRQRSVAIDALKAGIKESLRVHMSERAEPYLYFLEDQIEKRLLASGLENKPNIETALFVKNTDGSANFLATRNISNEVDLNNKIAVYLKDNEFSNKQAIYLSSSSTEYYQIKNKFIYLKFELSPESLSAGIGASILGRKLEISEEFIQLLRNEQIS